MEVFSKQGLVALQISADLCWLQSAASRRILVGSGTLSCSRGGCCSQRAFRLCARRCHEFNDKIGQVTIREKCSRFQALSQPSSEENFDLELEIFTFMQQSAKPDVFPTKEELISGGRADLVRAIVSEGGWLAAGWGEKETSSSADGSRATSSRRQSRKRTKVRASKISLKPSGTMTTPKRSNGLAGRSNNATNGVAGGVATRNVSRMNDNQVRRSKNDSELCEQFRAVEPAQSTVGDESRDVKAEFSNRSSEDDPQLMEDFERLFSFTGDLKLQKLQRGQQKQNFSQSPVRNYSLAAKLASAVPTIPMEETCPSATIVDTSRDCLGLEEELPGAQDSRGCLGEPAVRRRKKKHRRKGREKAVEAKIANDEVNGTLDWIAKMVDQREKWMFGAKPTSVEKYHVTSLVGDTQSVQDRIHTLKVKLVDTRAALESGRQALSQIGNHNDEVHQQSVSELVDAEDALEFKENAIMHARSELITTRAQVAAVEGHLQAEIMEARKTLEENNKKIEMARNVMKSLRTARIVWPNPATEVLVTGSFDGWNNQVKMQKSTAGVFVLSLPLYPGRYEIKFVVDGAWMVDTRRPIVYVGGYENNVLIVS